MTTLDNIKSELRKLDQKQLGELGAYIKGLRAVGGKPGGAQQKHSWVYDAFEAECKKLGLGFITKGVRAIVLQREAFLLQFLADGLPEDRHKELPLKRSIISAGVVLLYDDMLENGRVTNPRNLAFGLDRLPAVINRAFPGYAAAKLLFMMANQGRGK